jgi:predicted transcriptional regulator
MKAHTGEKLMRVREKFGITQMRLSEISGVTQAAISRIEKGKTKKPRLETLIDLVLALQSVLESGALK